MKHAKTRYNETKQGQTLIPKLEKTTQKEEESPKQAQELELHVILLLGVLQKHQTKSHNTYAVGFVKNLIGPSLTTSVSVIPHACLEIG